MPHSRSVFNGTYSILSWGMTTALPATDRKVKTLARGQLTQLLPSQLLAGLLAIFLWHFIFALLHIILLHLLPIISGILICSVV